MLVGCGLFFLDPLFSFFPQARKQAVHTQKTETEKNQSSWKSDILVVFRAPCLQVSVSHSPHYLTVVSPPPILCHACPPPHTLSAQDVSSQRLHSAGHWYYQGPEVSGVSTPPWFPMSTEASERLEDAYVRRWELDLDDTPIDYIAETGVLYTANFTLMAQASR